MAADPACPLDGMSLLPLLRGGPEFARPLHWRMKHRGQRALRDGRWKYLQVDGHEYLFDLQADERERANQAPREPERLAAMRQAWLDWNAGMPEPGLLGQGHAAALMPGRGPCASPGSAFH